MMIYYRDNCMWLSEADGDPTPEERVVMNVVSRALPDLPETVFIGKNVEYNRQAQGIDERGNWVEYAFTVLGLGSKSYEKEG